MDRLESLGNALSQITLYDIKSMYNQAKNVVLNVSEMEGKVREATNDEPWGASSTLMQEIAQGTFNFQNFNEIMPCIYARFMEKEAKQWRQIYKALQLLEYLVKNGSERVVDDARSHVATIKMLRNFYYIDDKGKDQGLNVRNRAKELVELLSDVEKIRGERRKAKANRNKYTGTGNDPYSFTSGGSRYGGFGSESLGYGGSSSSTSYGGGYSGERDYGDYSSGSGGFRDSSPRKNFEEYDAGDDDVAATRRSNSLSVRGTTSTTAPRRTATAPLSTSPPPATSGKAKAPEPVPNLLDFDDFSETAASTNANKALPVVGGHTEGDDDFDDFQTAPASAGLTAQPVIQAAPVPAVSTPAAQPSANLFNMLASTPMSPTTAAANRPPSYMASTMTTPMAPAMAQPMVSAMTPPAMAPTNNMMFSSQPMLSPSTPTSRAPAAVTPAAKPASSGNFDDLWTMSLGSSASSVKPAGGAPAPAKSIKDLEKEKAQAGIWGAGQQAKPSMGAGFGSFGAAPANNAPPASSGNGLDDLLL